MAMKDLGAGQRAKARALMPEVAQIVKPTAPAMGPRSMVTAPGTVRNFAKGGAVHSDAKQDKAMVRGMVKPSALKKAGGGAVARAKASPGSDAGTAVMHKKSGGKCMANGGTSGLGKGAAAGAPKPAPRTPSAGMKPAALKMAAGGAAKSRRGVSDSSGKPAPLPKGGKIPVNMTPPRKRR
jgi:hypothetical protein